MKSERKNHMWFFFFYLLSVYFLFKNGKNKTNIVYKINFDDII